MSEVDVQPVLRCKQCNKPFDKQSTLKRHGYYCRSRGSGSTTRSRSCICCARAKARCDNKLPICSRCITKATECRYPTNSSRNTVSRTHGSDNTSTEWRERDVSLVIDPPGIENCRDANNHDVILNTTFALTDPEFGNLGMNWGDSSIDFTSFLTPQLNDISAQNGSSRRSSLAHRPMSSTDEVVHVRPTGASLKAAIPLLPNCAPRLLIRRPSVRAGVRGITNLISHTLKSYPLMMMRQNTLPPYIHSRMMSCYVDDNHLNPLSNCINLVHMISHEVKGGRRLFWENVRLECERICEEHQRLNKWELLTAMQAISIYILIRLDEGETDHNNLDFLLLAAVTVNFVPLLLSYLGSDDIMQVIATQLTGNDTTCSNGLEINWENWIFEESRRRDTILEINQTKRLSVVYRIVNMLVYFEPAARCDMPADLILAPLPGGKNLWEAQDESIWKVESQREPGVQTAFGLAVDGRLVKLGDDRLDSGDKMLLHTTLNTRAPSRIAANWEEWCSGMDGFGGLVMLAASLMV
ncbi:hypothetical protein F5884DRAFT_875195 [Xylogone sp. PMI_703]|nr:hypothetical protein F5884DRAFT_875195 [Xylogone sp. PMI_703]